MSEERNRGVTEDVTECTADRPAFLLIADDDPDDQLLLADAFSDAGFLNRMWFVQDGVMLMNYLQGRGQYADREQFPHPDVVVLDLNMPGMNGQEVLAEMEKDSKLADLPVIVMTTSADPQEFAAAYDAGARLCVTKPPSYSGMVSLIQALRDYW